MEAIGAASSILAILGAALASAKAINDVLSAVKDRPHDIQSLDGEVAQLQSILYRVHHLQNGLTASTDLSNLTTYASRCAAEVTAFEKKLKRLRLSDNDRRFGRLWRRLKAIVSENDLRRMQAIVNSHTLALNLELSLVQTTQLSGSTTQYSEILSLLKQIKSDTASFQRPSVSTDAPSIALESQGVRGMEDVDNNPPSIPSIDVALQESIARLTKLVEENECTVESDGAEQLIHDLENLLESAQDKELESELPHTSQCLHGYQESTTVSNVLKELKLTKSLIQSTPAIAINGRAVATLMASVPAGIVFDQQRKRKTIDTGSGVLTISTNKRRRKYADQQQEDTADANGNRQRDFIVKIGFEPQGAEYRLSLFAAQSQSLHGSFLSVPNLSINNIVSRDSQVFQIAADGSVEDLKLLMAAGKANIHDHDPYGWSLLHFAVDADNPSMCKFLVENGLDVDEVSLHPNISAELTPLHLILHNCGPETGAILLEAGADPTIYVHNYICPFLVMADSNGGALSIFNKMLTTSAHFGLVHLRDFRGGTALSSLCDTTQIGTLDPKDTIGRIVSLLDKGFSILATADQGLTCLHTFFLCYGEVSNREEWHHLPILLVNRGADIHAVDGLGRSVSDVAYSETCLDVREKLGTYRGDLWDFVLDSCGYNIYEFRKTYPRKAKYDESYSRQDFELLWKDKEHRCPYWDDAEWPCLENNCCNQHSDGKREIMCARPGYCSNPIYRNSDSESDSETDASDSENELSDGDGETDLMVAQQSSPSVTDDCQSSLASQKSSVRQDSDEDGMHRQAEVRDFRHEISTSTWLSADRDDMEWDNTVPSAVYHRSSFQTRPDTLYDDELFHDPWADT